MSPIMVWLGRQWRLISPGRGSLARAWDRAEAAVLATAVLAALVAVPVAGVVVSEVRAAQTAVSRQQQAERHEVDAVVLEVTPPGLDSDDATATVVWRLPGGSDRTGTVPAGRGTEPGDRVPVWVDPAGEPVPTPLTASNALTVALAAGLLAWLGVVVVLGLLVALVRAGLDRLRLAAWEREWSEFGSDKTRW
ncbi:Rv1733c family protein [Amycolatopsis thermoflava]|uniref:Rv1733c family protein n=1 Tax=Amycolatopsis thermoflava TaxID=84480 RepID=UPI00365A9DBB